MAVKQVGRVLTLNLFILVQCIYSQEYSIPPVRIEVLKPKGFRASIEDAPKMALFTFQGNVNKDIGSNDVGDISGEVTGSYNGRWTFENLNVQLKVGDTIKYYVFVAVNSKGYISDGLTYTVKELGDSSVPSGTGTPLDCRPTQTLVRGGTACAGQVLFEDHFDSLNENVWEIEQYIPVFKGSL